MGHGVGLWVLRDDNLLLPIERKRGKYEFTDKAIIIIKIWIN